MPQGLICSHSEYFDKAFSGTFKEGQEKIVKLLGVEKWVFESFVGWLYTQGIYRRNTTRSEAKKEANNTRVQSELARRSFGPDEEVEDNPVTWTYADLFTLYIFADSYCIRGLRNEVINIIQIKLMQEKPRQYDYPTTDQLCYAYQNLPETSSLCRLLIHVQAFDIKGNEPDSSGPESERNIPFAVLAKVIVLTQRVLFNIRYSKTKCRRGQSCNAEHEGRENCDIDIYERDVCGYHEHTSKGEKEMCLLRWTLIRQQHDISEPSCEPWDFEK